MWRFRHFSHWKPGPLDEEAGSIAANHVGPIRPVRSCEVSEVTVLSAARQRGSMPLRGRSYMAFALTPEPPIADWLGELDVWLRGSAGFFAGRPVVLDLSAVTLTSSAIAHLISELGTRGIRIMRCSTRARIS